MFAYATWSLSDHKFNCVVDVTPYLEMADVMVNSVGSDADLFNFLQRNGTYGESDHAVPAHVLVFLGSTSRSLQNEATGEYFSVDETTLTTEGAAVVSALEALYGPATFTTYLDT